MDDDHDLVADFDSDTLIRIAQFLKRGKAPGPDNIHNEVLRLGATTLLFHHLARLFTSSIQIGYLPPAWKLATLRMMLKPNKLPSLSTSYRPISLMSSIRNSRSKTKHYSYAVTRSFTLTRSSDSSSSALQTEFNYKAIRTGN